MTSIRKIVNGAALVFTANGELTPVNKHGDTDLYWHKVGSYLNDALQKNSQALDKTKDHEKKAFSESTR